MPPTTGVIDKGKHRGWLWQSYPDPASPTGWSKKIWNPRDRSDNGKPTEYFDDDFDTPDAIQQEQQQAAQAMARQQQQAAAGARRQENLDRQEQDNAAWLDNVGKESRRRFDTTAGLQERTRQDAINRAKESLKEQRRQFDLTYGLNQREADLNDRKFGADLLKFGSTLTGPANVFQGFAFGQGVANGPLSQYVRAVYGGANGPTYGGGTATGASPTPLTVGSLAKSLTGESGGTPGVPTGAGAGSILNGPGAAPGSSGTGPLDTLGRTLSPEQQQYLAPIKESLEGGIAQKGLGYFENMSPGQQKAFFSGAGFLGWDPDEVKTRYLRSRPGQGSALAA